MIFVGPNVDPGPQKIKLMITFSQFSLGDVKGQQIGDSLSQLP